MSSWWVKDDTTDTNRTEADGPRGAQNIVDNIRKKLETKKQRVPQNIPELK